MKIRNEQDFWAGIMFMATGVFFVIVALGTPEWLNQLWGDKLVPGYQMGTAVRMGPAYFPVVLGGLMAILGAVIFSRAYFSRMDAAHSVVKLPFNIVDLAIAAGVFVVATYVTRWFKVSHDYAMLGSALALSALAIRFRPDAKALVLILASSLAFAYLLKPLGLVVASIMLVFISAIGGHEFKFREVAILSAVLVVFSVLVFVKGLTLPFPICPAFVETCPIR